MRYFFLNEDLKVRIFFFLVYLQQYFLIFQFKNCGLEVLHCKVAINSYSGRGTLNMVWVPGHAGVAGNERTNFFAHKATELNDIDFF